MKRVSQRLLVRRAALQLFSANIVSLHSLFTIHSPLSTISMAGKTQKALPGFRLSLGFALIYLFLLVLFPLGACIAKAASLSPAGSWAAISAPQAVAAYKLSFTVSFIAGLGNAVVGFIAAWVLVRYRFPGTPDTRYVRRSAFWRLPTAVAGITFASLFAPNGWYGRYLSFLEPEGWLGHWFGAQGWFGQHFLPLDVRADDGPFAIVLVLMFVGMPFVIRALQPVLAELDAEQEEAAAILGANRWQTFRYVILPAIMPAWLTGFASRMRGLGNMGR